MDILSGLITRNCPVCQIQYQADPKRLKHGRQTTCSRKCSYILRSNLIKKPKVSFVCPVCQKPFEKLNSQLKSSQKVYCSQPCAYKGRSLGFSKRIVNKPYRIKQSRQKTVIVQCQSCKKDIQTIPSLQDRKKFCSLKCQSDLQRQNMKGSNNFMWIDGRSYQKRCYRGSDWEKQRLAAYKRDNYTCQCCGVKCVGRKSLSPSNSTKLIQCHHRVFWSEKPDNSLENLVTLCVSCHAKIHQFKKDINEPT